MTDLTKLSANKLNALISKRHDATMIIIIRLIEAGYGNEKGQDTRKRAAETGDPLALAYIKANDLEYNARAEMSARLRYQGNPNPIRRYA